jgi:toxin CcdB
LLVDVQADIIPNLGTKLTIPLLDASGTPRAMPRLHPVIDFEDRAYVLGTHLLAAVPLGELGPPRWLGAAAL